MVVCFFRRLCSASAWYLVENVFPYPQAEPFEAFQKLCLCAHHTLFDPEVEAVVVFFFRRWCSASAWYLVENDFVEPQLDCHELILKNLYLFAHHLAPFDPEVDAVVVCFFRRLCSVSARYFDQ